MPKAARISPRLPTRHEGPNGKGVNMARKKFVLLGALLAVVVFALALAPSATLAGKKTKTRVRGYVSALDTAANKVTIHDTKNNTDVTLNVVEKTKIRKNKVKDAALADLTVGDWAKAKYSANSGDARRIRAKSPKAQGEITVIGANSVTIKNRQGVQVTLQVTADTKIRRHHERVTLAKLAVGDHAKANYEPATMQAKRIRARGGSAHD